MCVYICVCVCVCLLCIRVSGYVRSGPLYLEDFHRCDSMDQLVLPSLTGFMSLIRTRTGAIDGDKGWGLLAKGRLKRPSLARAHNMMRLLVDTAAPSL